MRTLSLSVVRKNRQMKWRVIGISLLMAWAAGMFAMGLYGAEAMDASIEDRVENFKFPDAIVTMDGLKDRGDLTTTMDGLVSSGDVEAYQLRLILEGHYHHDGKRYPAILVGLEDPTDESINRLEIREGSFFTDVNETVVQAGMEAEGLVKGTDALFTVLGQDMVLEVTGLGSSTEFMMAGDVSLGGFSLPGGVAIAFLPLEQLQSLMQDGTPIGDKVNSVAFLADDVDAVLAELDAFGVRSTILMADHPSIIFLSANADEWRLILPVISGLFLVVGGFAILMVFTRVIQNDTRFIGVLMAMGYNHREIIRAYLSFGLSIALLSSALSVIFGVGISFAILGLFADMIGDIGIVMPFVVMPFVYGIVVCFIFVFAALVWPLSKLKALTPSEALEHHDEGSIFVTSRRRRGSKLITLGLRNTFRRPKQTFATILVIGLAIGVTGAWYVVGDSSMSYIMDLNEADEWDVEVNFASNVPVVDIDESFLGIPVGSTESIMTFRSSGGLAAAGDRQSAVMVMASDDLESIRNFDVERGQLNTSGAMIAVPLAGKLGIGPGDDIVLTIPGGQLVLPVTAVVHALVETMVYIPLSESPDPTTVNGAFLILSDSASENDVRQGLYGNDQVTNVVFKADVNESLSETVDMLMEFFFSFMYLNGFIAFIIAAATVTVIASERDMEYATMKSLGMNRKEIAKPILLEMGVLTAGAVAVSLPVAYVFGIYLGDLYGRTSMYFPISLSMEAVVFTVILGVVFTMAASIVPIRHAWNVDVERMIRERTSG